MAQNVRELKDIMKQEVEKYVKAYKQDFDLDLQDFKKRGGGQRYLWLLRECGTALMDRAKLNYRNSVSFKTFEYYHPSAIEKAYEVYIESVEGDRIIGTCQQISDYDNYHQELFKQAQISHCVTFEIERKTGERTQHQLYDPSGELRYENCLRIAGVDYEEVAEFNVIAYK